MPDKYCKNCNKNVSPKKKFHIIAFLLLLIFIWVPIASYGFFVVGFVAVFGKNAGILAVIWLGWLSLPILYILNHIFLKTPRCPICNKKLRRRNETKKREHKE
jgi:hypothetical protein